MALKSYKPTTPGQRQLVLVDRSALYKGKPVKALTEGKNSSGGRNNLGRVTVRFRGGGHKRTLRLVDFKRRGHANEAATVERIEYDPNRTAFIALVSIRTASSPTSWRRSVLRRATRWSRATRSTSSRQRDAARQHADRSRSCITSS
jgi:ribosomal protein L2